MSANHNSAAALPNISENLDTAPAVELDLRQRLTPWMLPLEVCAAILMVVIVALLLGGVLSRYVFQVPLVWIDEAASIAFVWVVMIGAALAMHRNEHLRLTLFVNLVPEKPREYVRGFALVAMLAFLVALL